MRSYAHDFNAQCIILGFRLTVVCSIWEVAYPLMSPHEVTVRLEEIDSQYSGWKRYSPLSNSYTQSHGNTKFGKKVGVRSGWIHILKETGLLRIQQEEIRIRQYATALCKVRAGNKVHLTHFLMSAKTYSLVLNETLRGGSLGP